MLNNLSRVTAEIISYMLESSVLLQQVNVKKSEKLTKIANTDKENIFWTTFWISMKFTKKVLTFDNIKSHLNSGLHSLYRKQIVEKLLGGSNWRHHSFRVKKNIKPWVKGESILGVFLNSKRFLRLSFW